MLSSRPTRRVRRLWEVVLASALSLVTLATVLAVGIEPAAAYSQRANLMWPVDGLVSSAAGTHHRVLSGGMPYGQPGDWSMDIHTSGQARPAYARFDHRDGLALEIVHIGETCRNGGGGQYVVVNVKVGGIDVGRVAYGHLVNVRGRGPLNNGDQIGTVATGLNPPDGSSCWSGPHVHMEASNFQRYSCFTPVAAGHNFNVTGHVMGIVGGEFASGVNQRCPDGAWNWPVLPPSEVTIRSNANGRLVSSELGYGGGEYGMLRARADTALAWERFRLLGDCSRQCAIQSLANGKYVSAELGYDDGANGMLRARADTALAWEQFRLEGNCSTGCAIRSLANGRLVSAELGYGGHWNGQLRARADQALAWEMFRIG